jgi:hypothetical protein
MVARLTERLEGPSRYSLECEIPLMEFEGERLLSTLIPDRMEDWIGTGDEVLD